MKISEVRVIVTCPAGQTFVVVKIITDSGVYGVGEGTKNGRELAVAALLEHHIAPVLIGRDPGAIEDIWKLLYKGAYWRRGPIPPTATAPTDLPPRDLKSQDAGLPVHSAPGRPSAPTARPPPRPVPRSVPGHRVTGGRLRPRSPPRRQRTAA